MIKGSIQEETTISSTCMYPTQEHLGINIKQMLTVIRASVVALLVKKGEINSTTIIAGNSMDRSSRQKINTQTPAFKIH